MLKKLINNTLTDLFENIDFFEKNEKFKSILLYIGADFKIDNQQLSEKLKSLNTSIIGAVFPEIICDGKRYSDKAVILGLDTPLEYTIIDNFEEDTISYKIANEIEVDFEKENTFVIFIDALIRDKTILFDSLYNYYGSIPNYIGGGAGSLEFKPFPNVITNDGILEGIAVVASLPHKINMGVAHGWQAISKTLKVTEANKNKIISLDWKPAMQVYREIIEEHAKIPFDFDNFFNSTKSYPFGIQKLNDNMIIRDPFMTEDGNIFLLDDVDEGSYVQIMYGNLESLIAGAKEARSLAEVDSDNKDNTFIIDCISRVLFMENSFEEELKELDPLKNSFGALTLGEIANNGNSYLDVYNKTAVVGIVNK